MMTGFDLEDRALREAYAYDDTFNPDEARQNSKESGDATTVTRETELEVVPDGRRSLCVGDVVVIGETAWFVDSSGFVPCDTDELRRTMSRPVRPDLTDAVMSGWEHGPDGKACRTE